MTYDELYADPEGLNGFSLKKIRIKDVSIKNAVKVAKVAVPIATSFIPIGGGVISGVASKLLKNKAGGANLVGRIANSATAISKTKVGSLVTTQAKKVINNTIKPQSQPQVQAVNQITPASFSYESQISQSETTEPVGELTPVKPSTAKTAIAPVAEKNNTMLWVLGAAVVGGGIYLATKDDSKK